LDSTTDKFFGNKNEKMNIIEALQILAKTSFKREQQNIPNHCHYCKVGIGSVAANGFFL